MRTWFFKRKTTFTDILWKMWWGFGTFFMTQG